MKREKFFLCLLAMFILLTACGKSKDDPTTEQAAVPSRMVQFIEVAIHPTDEKMNRSYTDMEKMSPILRYLRDMDTNQKPAEEPDLTDGQTYYTITATYANGESRVYYLLSHQYFRIDEGAWCKIDYQDAMDLIQYIRNTPDSNEVTEVTEETQAEETESAEESQETDETNASE